MNIAIITPGFLPVPAIYGGAVETLIEYIVNENEKTKTYKIDLYTIFDENLNKEKYNYKYTNIITIKTSLFDKLKSVIYNRFYITISILNKKAAENYISPYSVKIKKIINHKKYDYIIIENNMTVVNSLKKMNNLVFHLHNDIYSSDKPLYQCKLMMKCCKKIIVVSQFLKKRLSLCDSKNLSKISVLPNCINLDDFKKSNKTNISSNKYTFFYSGRIVPEKGVLELIQAFNKVKEKNKNCKLIIVGKSVFNKNTLTDYELKIKKEASKNLNSILFTGFVEHSKISKILSQANCVVIPSKCDETFGVVALEAMISKKPIISTKSGGIVEVVNKDCAIIIDKKPLENNLVDAMLYALNNKNYMKRLGENGYKKVKSTKDYHKEQYFKNFKTILEEV